MSSQEEKLEESEYFYDIMMENYKNEAYKKFNHSLSAFLASTRSVLQYTYDYAKSCGRVKEYDGLLSGNRTLVFFKDKRNFNIHNGPVKANQEVIIMAHDRINIQISESISMTMTYADGTEETRTYDSRDEQQTTEKLPELPSTERTLRYRFNDWPGAEDVLELADEYLEELRVFIQKAKVLGLIT